VLNRVHCVETRVHCVEEAKLPYVEARVQCDDERIHYVGSGVHCARLRVQKKSCIFQNMVLVSLRRLGRQKTMKCAVESEGYPCVVHLIM
jgi:hypothetical protein